MAELLKSKVSRFLSLRKRSEQVGRNTRQLWLGVDYGTSKSKLVITDYDAVEGDRSFVVRSALEYGGDYRIPSAVSVADGALHFGFAAEALGDHAPVYRSLKMLCAYPDEFYGDVPLPASLRARDLATLYVGYLMRLGRSTAARYASRFRAEPSLGVTLGVPMAQLDDQKLYEMFVHIAREAFELAHRLDFDVPVALGDAMEELGDVRAELGGTFPHEPRDWVRSEAEAALFWPYRSPDVGDGRFACVDVGAGTTSASWFHISAERDGGLLVSNRLSFYGAECAPPACDAIDQVLAKHVDGADSLGDIRGREVQLLKDLREAGKEELDLVLVKIASVFGTASVYAFEKQKSMLAWRNLGRIFFLGGGTKLPEVQDKLIEKKREWLKSDPVADLGVPGDLMEEDGTELREDASFLLVAYGLARRLGDVPDTFRPSEVSDYRPRLIVREPPSRDELYSD